MHSIRDGAGQVIQTGLLLPVAIAVILSDWDFFLRRDYRE